MKSVERGSDLEVWDRIVNSAREEIMKTPHPYLVISAESFLDLEDWVLIVHIVEALSLN